MKIILILFFYLLSYTSLYSQTDSSFYFPMKTGNLWQYKEPPPPDDPYITEIRIGRDTTFSNGQTYRSFLVDTYGYPDTGLQAYRRQIGNKVYRYFPNQQKEYLIYDFSKNVRDTVAIYPSPIEPGDSASGIQEHGNGQLVLLNKGRQGASAALVLAHGKHQEITSGK